MKTSEKVPDGVTTMKVLEYVQGTPRPEGIHLVSRFLQVCDLKTNWLLFYFWCYSRTNGFLSAGCKDWDYGNLGAKYDTSLDGARDAFNEFSKFDDTSLMENGEEVLGLYNDCVKWCAGEIHKPVPVPPKPEPEPLPEPIPAPVPVPVPETPPAKAYDWKGLLKIVGPFFRP